ncbi:MAG TPA: hypothetical protein V6D06_03205 [Trichocoleus sp.]
MQSPFSPSSFSQSAVQSPQARAQVQQASEGTAVTEDHVLAALMGVIRAARQQGQSVEEVQAAVLADDALLEMPVRQLLSDIVAEAWHQLN